MPFSDQKRIDVADWLGNVVVRQRGKAKRQKTSAVRSQPIGCVGVAIERVAFSARLGNDNVMRGDARQFAQGCADLARPDAQQNAAREHNIERLISKRQAVRGRLMHLESASAPSLKNERRNVRSHETGVTALSNRPKIRTNVRADFKHASGAQISNCIRDLRAQRVRACLPVAVEVGGVSRFAFRPKAPRRCGLSVEEVQHAVH